MSKVLADLGVAEVRYHGVGGRDPVGEEHAEGMVSGGGRWWCEKRDCTL